MRISIPGTPEVLKEGVMRFHFLGTKAHVWCDVPIIVTTEGSFRLADPPSEEERKRVAKEVGYGLRTWVEDIFWEPGKG